MGKHKAKVEDFDARMEEIRVRHRKPIPSGTLKDRLKQAVLKSAGN